MSTADTALQCAKACQDAQKLVTQIKTGDALPDSLHACPAGHPRHWRWRSAAQLHSRRAESAGGHSLMPRTAIASSAAGTERAFEHLRTRAARAGHTLHKRFEDGQDCYLVTCWSQCRRFQRLDQLHVFVDLVTGAIDAKVQQHKGVR